MVISFFWEANYVQKQLDEDGDVIQIPIEKCIVHPYSRPSWETSTDKFLLFSISHGVPINK